MRDDLTKKLANLAKKAEGEMPPGMVQPQMDAGMGQMDAMAAPMGPQPVPTAEEIMAMQQDPSMGMAPLPAMPPQVDQSMMAPEMIAPEVQPAIKAEPSPEELAVDLANAKALSSMGEAVRGLTDVMAKQQASTTATMMNAADAIVASPVGEELTPEDIGPLMDGDAV